MKTEQPVVLVILACSVGAGAMVATGRASIALALALAALLTIGVVLERRRLALALWVGVAFTAPMQNVRVAPSITLSDLLIVAALLTILPDVHHGWRRVVPAGTVPAFGLLITAGLIGTFFASNPAASLTNLFKIVLAAAGSVVAMALWDPGVARLRRFAWTWLAGATVSMVWASLNPRAYQGRAIGLTNHPNHFGLVCMLAVGLGLGLSLSATGRARATALVVVVLQAFGVGLSGSRAAVLGLVVTMAVTAVLARKFRLLVATGVLVVLGTMAAMVGIVRLRGSNAIARLAGGGESAASDLARKQRLGEALTTIARHPFTGEGFEFAQAAHNIYLQALVVGGPLALLSLLLVVGLIVQAGRRAARTARGRPDGTLLAGLTAGYVGYLAAGVFEPILWDRYLWTYIGLLIVLAASRRPPSRASDGPREAREAGLLVAAAS